MEKENYHNLKMVNKTNNKINLEGVQMYLIIIKIIFNKIKKL